ncbi:MAG: transcription termination factor NusA [Candidatus Enteromonas sp.]|nr:transcription termination factor NusA [Candidatus Enteromonas sp.]
MPKKKQDEQIDLLSAAKAVALEKHLPLDAVLSALESALIKGYIRVLGGGDDAVVECHINPETGELFLAQIKEVRKDDEVEDDYLQIEESEANEMAPEGVTYAPGDRFAIPADFDDISNAATKAMMNYFRGSLAEAERAELYDIYKDHIGEMVTGTVLKADDRTVVVDIGRAQIEMTRRELIRDEYFKQGDPIKVYIQEVRPSEDVNGKKRGPMIEATRASEGFLKRLFEEEIHEIYDGSVVIKGISRAAGIRSKIAVTSTKEGVDATGACIGPGGSRITKIVNQLGNSRNKEKIDIIEWSDYAPKFIMDSVRPILALGVSIDEENKFAKVVLAEEVYRQQMGRYRQNLPLASRLTGYRIELIGLNEALASGISFITVKEAEEEEARLKKAAAEEEYRRKTAEEAKKREEEARAEAERKEAERLAALEEERRKKEEAERASRLARVEPLPEMPAVTPKASASESDFPAEAINPAAAALAALQSQRALAAQARDAATEEATPEEGAPVAPEAAPIPEPVEEKREVKTTTTLSALEEELESSRHSSSKPSYSKGSKRPRKISEEEVKREAAPKIPGSGMEIYTEQELAQMEEEDRNASLDSDLPDDDIDYEDYDEYYDDEK